VVGSRWAGGSCYTAAVATKKKPAPEIEQLKVRRGRPEKKPLPPHIDAFARGDDDALWRRERRGARLNDPRPVVLVPGVKNADARVVFDARVRRMHEAQAAHDEVTLACELAEVQLLGLWRANNVVSFDVLVEVALGLAPEKARALAAQGREELGLPERLSEAEIAVWMRAEAGVLEASESGRVRLESGRLVVSVAIEWAAHALAAAGRREAPLENVAMGQHSVLDRPRGVPSMRDILERERKIREGDGR
jgi:hypothetical protein